MKPTSPARQGGVTLLELLLGLAITALVLVPLVPMLQAATAATRIGGGQAALEREADFAIERISDRIRATTPSTQLPANRDDWLKPAIFTRTGDILYEQQAGINYALAESVTSFNLVAPVSIGGPSAIQVSLTLERDGLTATAGATVRMGGVQ
jgi:Tfp pilus assembly protein FimT